MKKLIRVLVVLLLVFNGIGALYGSYNFIVYPDGSSMHMSTAYLQHSPFGNYLVPGIILFVMNGACSFIVLAALLVNYQNAALLVAAQGAILTGWIGIQIVMLQIVFYLHFVMGAVGILLLVFGIILMRTRNLR